MQVATILPQNYLGLIKNDDYFMCLGNLIGAPGMEEYTDFYTKRSREGKFVIMDNGLIEKDPRPIEELADKALSIGASEMVMTDVFCDRQKTLNAIADGVDRLKAVVHPKLMLVPQGNSVDDWIKCAHEIIMTYNTMDFTIGVPKVLVHLGGRDGRAAAISGLQEVCPIVRHFTFHLLGCWTTPLEVTMIDKLQHSDDKFPHIRGVDSAMPLVYARANKLLDHQDRPDSEPINFQYTKVNDITLRRNIHIWRKAADSQRRF